MDNEGLLDFSPKNVKIIICPLFICLSKLYSNALSGSGVKYSKPRNGGPHWNPNRTGPISRPSEGFGQSPVRAVFMFFFFCWLRKLGLDRSQLEQSCLLQYAPPRSILADGLGAKGGREERYFSAEPLCTENQQGNQGSDCWYSQSSCHHIFKGRAREFLTEVTVAWDTTHQLSCSPPSACSYPNTNRRKAHLHQHLWKSLSSQVLPHIFAC